MGTIEKERYEQEIAPDNHQHRARNRPRRGDERPQFALGGVRAVLGVVLPRPAEHRVHPCLQRGRPGDVPRARRAGAAAQPCCAAGLRGIPAGRSVHQPTVASLLCEQASPSGGHGAGRGGHGTAVRARRRGAGSRRDGGLWRAAGLGGRAGAGAVGNRVRAPFLHHHRAQHRSGHRAGLGYRHRAHTLGTGSGVLLHSGAAARRLVPSAVAVDARALLRAA